MLTPKAVQKLRDGLRFSIIVNLIFFVLCMASLAVMLRQTKTIRAQIETIETQSAALTLSAAVLIEMAALCDCPRAFPAHPHHENDSKGL